MPACMLIGYENNGEDTYEVPLGSPTAPAPLATSVMAQLQAASKQEEDSYSAADVHLTVCVAHRPRPLCAAIA
jgi:hypothetical protein